MSLRAKYDHAIQACKGRMEGSADEKDGKLFIRGTVKSETDKNLIWDAIKTVPDWRTEVVAEISVVPKEGEPAGGRSTYTVKPGDTLSRIAKEQLGDANAYMKIFEANRDLLTDPDKIKPGQVLRIPAS
jgi:nucleoid-associated protein YgaU